MAGGFLLMGCFDDIIALRGACTEVTPKSGYYLDDIDLYRGEIEKFIQKPYNDVDSFVTDKILFATKAVQSVMYTEYQHLYLSRSILDGQRIGYTNDNMQLQTGSSNLRGIEIELCNESSFVDFYVSEISLFIDTAGARNIYVYDLLQNKLLDTITITTVANNITTVYPHKTYKSDRKKLNLFIGYDSTNINSYLTSFSTDGCFTCKSNGYKNAWVSVNGAEYTAAESKIASNATPISHTSGISIQYSLKCNHEDWLCNQMGVLALPVLYRTAADIMNYALNTTERFNSKTNLDFEELKNKRDFYDSKYHETLRGALSRMLLPSDRTCFICNDRARVSYVV